MPRSSNRRRNRIDRGDPNLIPLLDVVLQLIAFFMMLVHVGTRIEGATDFVRLPEAPAALPTTDLGFDRLAVAIDTQGRLVVGNEARDKSSARAWWHDQASQRRAGIAAVGQKGPSELPTLVVVRADRAAPYGAVREMLEVARSEGFTRYTLVVLKQEGPR